MTNFMIAEALADNGAAAPQGSPMVTLAMLVLMFVAFYFLLIRPQAKRAKEHKNMIAALAKGDEVVAGGMLGRVTHVSEQMVTVEIAENVEVKMQKHAIQAVLPKGTLKSA